MPTGIGHKKCYLVRMKSGRINSKGSMATADRLFHKFGGSWKAIDAAATRDANGVFVIRRTSAGQFVPTTEREKIKR